MLARTTIWACAALAVLGHTAMAQPAQTPARPSALVDAFAGPPTDAAKAPAPPEVTLDSLTRSARQAAATGQCSEVAKLGRQVRAIAPSYYAVTFTTDAAITGCAEPGHDKSPALAAGLALTGTLGGVAATDLAINVLSPGAGIYRSPPLLFATLGVSAAALAFGPSLGRIYVGHGWNWWLKLRLIGVGAVLLGVTLDVAGATPRVEDGPPAGGSIGLLVGGAAWLVGTVGENIATPMTAIGHNRRLARRSDVGWVPVVVRGGAGLAMVGRF